MRAMRPICKNLRRKREQQFPSGLLRPSWRPRPCGSCCGRCVISVVLDALPQRDRIPQDCWRLSWKDGVRFSAVIVLSLGMRSTTVLILLCAAVSLFAWMAPPAMVRNDLVFSLGNLLGGAGLDACRSHLRARQPASLAR